MTTPLISLNSQRKDSDSPLKIIDTGTLFRINKFLKAVPHLEFSSTDIDNIARRLKVSKDAITSLIEEARNG